MGDKEEMHDGIDQEAGMSSNGKYTPVVKTELPQETENATEMPSNESLIKLKQEVWESETQPNPSSLATVTMETPGTNEENQSFTDVNATVTMEIPGTKAPSMVPENGNAPSSPNCKLGSPFTLATFGSGSTVVPASTPVYPEYNIGSPTAPASAPLHPNYNIGSPTAPASAPLHPNYNIGSPTAPASAPLHPNYVTGSREHLDSIISEIVSVWL